MMTTKQKLLKLADFLEHEVKNLWFNLETWSSIGFTEKECGTTACAAGWATVCFPRSGLSLVPNEYHDDSLEIIFKRTRTTAELDYFRGQYAVEAFFDIDSGTAKYLFDPGRYPLRQRCKKSVIRRLREIANNGRVIDDDKTKITEAG